MATYTNTWRNKVWVGWFFLNLPIIFFMDLLDYIWPASLYEPVGSPLHFAFQMKEWYIQKYNDPIVQWSVETASGHDSWMGLFMHLEAFFLLPTVLYGIYRLVVQRRGTSGCDELLFLVYALEVAFTTLICIYDTGFLDEAVYSAEIKHELQYQVYAAWAVLPTLGAIDMAFRILGRIKAADAAQAAKKSQ
ncbi:transmembrane protein 6/97 [Chaetomium sp. MPI-SDFR-AT-0129]|uniref:Efficient mitochondria targeting-associated protein 19 n=1 Tax=Dichotomopilus funicola TaxID=1934379 RepID=A0AAN6UW37_9PEZI|nr:transmembrane protein 6/97 [Chaetomium sp. MPI-SDFR-AT-0129]KAK4139605.1 transmembrane protein 6/97 [Dichotomopilus funicola]